MTTMKRLDQRPADSETVFGTPETLLAFFKRGVEW